MINESIFSGKLWTIPMADVGFYEKDQRPEYMKNITIYFKYSKFNNENQQFEPNIYLCDEQADEFKKAWCQYRYEYEKLDEQKASQ